MEFKAKGSMILISILFILVLSIGMVSASQDIDATINNDYQSNSINMDTGTNTIDNDNIEKLNSSTTDIKDYETFDKSKDKLYDDGDDSIEEDPEDPEDPIEDEVYLSYELSEPENGRDYVEGEEITITYHLEDAIGDDAYGEYIINIFCEDENSNIDEYLPFTINGTSNFTISNYYPVGNYVVYCGKMVFDPDTGEEFYGIMEDVYWNDGFEDSPEIIIKTNYNKQVNATLTVGYSIIELENITEGDPINGGVRVEDEFGNRLNDKLHIALYKYDEEEGEYVSINQDTPTSSNGMARFKFENLEVGDYYLIVEHIEHEDEFEEMSYEYNNINTQQINFTVKRNIDPNDYKINLKPESNEITADKTYTISIQILDPYNETYEGSVELYNNETKIADINISYEDGEDYCNYTINELKIGVNNLTIIYKINEELNASKSIQIIRFGANLELTRLDNNVIVNLTDLDSNPIVNASVQVNANGEVSIVQTDENGTYTIPISGNSTVKATYINPISKEVLRSTIDVIYETEIIEKNNTVIINNTIEVPVNATISLSTEDGSKVIAKLTDLDGKAISNAKIKLTINGKESNMTTGSDGSVILFVNGNNTISASYTTASNNTISSSIMVTVITNEIIREINNTIEVPVNATISLSTEDGSKVIAKLTDLDGKAISNAKIKLTINGKESNMTTGSDGSVILFVNGNNTISASYTTASNNTVSSSIRTTVITNEIIKEINNTIIINNTVKRAATKINYNDMKTVAVNTASDGRVGKYFNVTLTDVGGNPLANKEIKIGFNGKIYNKTTDANGFAKLQINLARAEVYTFAVAFLGDDEYNASFIVAKINVTKQSPKLTTANKSYKKNAKTKTLTATFKTALGNPIKSKKITFTVNGKTYTGTTNANGVASVKVSLSKKGTYSFTVKYAGDNTFNTVSKTGKLTIS